MSKLKLAACGLDCNECASYKVTMEQDLKAAEKMLESVGGDYINLSFPIIPVAVFSLIYIFVPYIISSAAVRQLLKSTTVELIGQEV